MKWVGLDSSIGLQVEQGEALVGPQNSLKGKAQLSFENGLGGLEAQVSIKDISVNTHQRVLENSTKDTSSEETSCEEAWSSEEPRSEAGDDDETPTQGVLPLLVPPGEVVIGDTPRLVTPGIPSTLEQFRRTDVVNGVFGKVSLPAQELAVVEQAQEETTWPLENLPMVLFDGDTGEGSSSPLTCTPLNMVGPFESPQAMVPLGDGIDALSQPLSWVAWHMNMFRKQIGVSIKGHEVECLALLRKIEEDRKPKSNHNGVKRTSRKGTRELRNLASSVNYDGKQLSCC